MEGCSSAEMLKLFVAATVWGRNSILSFQMIKVMAANGGGMDVHADILLLIHKGAPFGKCVLTTHNLPKKWAPFDIA